MPRAKKKVTRKTKTPNAGRSAHNSSGSWNNREIEHAPSSKDHQSKPNQRKRGWRDIEAISERARLKKMLADIWHEDIEIDEDIFGGSDHLSGYYTDLEVEAEIEVDEDEVGEPEEFDEKEK
jgi:hypothetical protein